MRAAPVVVKIGGRALEAPGATRELADAVKALACDVVLVHGGGAELSGWCDRLGLTSRFADGLRVTDPATLEVATAVLAGLANKRLVAALRDAGLDAVGLSALDGGTAVLEPHPDAARLGAVGRVARIDPALVTLLLARGMTPVLASIGDHAGALLNVNADDFAAALAGALGARALVLLSDTPGLVLDGAQVPALAEGDLAAAIAHADVTGGMVPKLHAARAALALGARTVSIAAWSGPDTLRAILAGEAVCTRIVSGSAETFVPFPASASTQEAHS